MPKEIEPIEDLNPVTEIRKKVDGKLVVERTYQKPVTATTTYDIGALKAKIAKYQSVIAIWEAKIVPLRKIIDEYNEYAQAEYDQEHPNGGGI